MLEAISNSKEETQKIAFDLAKRLGGGEILCFFGNLGAGKTTFIQGLAKKLGVKQNVTSPTFVLMKKYKTPKNNFYHLDCYRLSSPQEAIDLGIEEIWENKNNIIAIEWADKITDILPKKHIDICLESLSENERKITIFE